MVEQIIENIKAKFPVEIYNTNKETNLYGLIKSFAAQLKEFKNIILLTKGNFFISTVEGINLEEFVLLFALQRKLNETDESLKNRFLAHWEGATGGGTKENILLSSSIFSGVSFESLSIVEMFDLKFKINLFMVSGNIKDNFVNFIWKNKAAGIYPFFLFTLIDDVDNNGIAVNDSIEIFSEVASMFLKINDGRVNINLVG